MRRSIDPANPSHRHGASSPSAHGAAGGDPRRPAPSWVDQDQPYLGGPPPRPPHPSPYPPAQTTISGPSPHSAPRSDRGLPGDASEGLEATPSKRKRKRSWAAIAASTLILLSTAGLIAFLGLERNLVARTVPGAASLYAAVGMPTNPHGLALKNVKVDWVEEDNQTELEVRGEVHNLLQQERRVPSVVIVVRDRSGANLFHTVGAVGSGLVSRGGFTRFTARIASPPPGTASVAVHFPAPK